MENPPTPEQQPRQITFKDLFKNTVKMVSFWSKHKQQVSLLGSLAFAGLLTAFPERLKGKGLLNGTNFPITDQAINLGIKVNDWVDLFPWRKRKIAADQQAKEATQPYFRDILKKWKAIVAVLYGERNEGGWVKPLVNSYQREIIWLNRMDNQMPDEKLTFALALKIQELENAISLVHIAATCLGPEALANRTYHLGDRLSWTNLKAKYSWMIENRPVNETEKRLCALFDILMIGQMYDHWHDYEQDRQLGLRTPAAQAISACNGDRKKAWEMLKRSIEEYSSRARKFGVSEGAITGWSLMSKIGKGVIQKAIPSMGGKRRQLLSDLTTV